MRIICNNRPMLIRNIYILSFISSNRYDLDTRLEMIKNFNITCVCQKLNPKEKNAQGDI